MLKISLFILTKSRNSQVSINWRMNEENVVYPYHEILFTIKKKWNTDKCYSIDETWNYVKWKKHKWLQGLWFYLCEMSRVSTSIAMESRLVMVNTQEREGPRVGTIGAGFLLVLCLVAAPCPILRDPMDCILCPWGFSRWECWNGLLCPPPGDLPSPRIESRSPALQADSLPAELPGKPKVFLGIIEMFWN